MRESNGSSEAGMEDSMKIALGSDHAGFRLKRSGGDAQEMGHEPLNLGTFSGESGLPVLP